MAHCASGMCVQSVAPEKPEVWLLVRVSQAALSFSEIDQMGHCLSVIVLEQGGIKAILEALLAHKDNVAIQEQG